MALTRAAAWPLEHRPDGPHELHGDERIWTESNCYVDLWIEVLQALRLEPIACLPFTLTTDFEGDQWTFFKPPLDDLRDLYGIRVEELNVWRPLVDHSLEQLSLGRLVIAEVDAYFLPDTAGTTYGVEHAKTSIAMHAIDLEAHTLSYFHARGYYSLGGADFDGLFHLSSGLSQIGWLAPYVEIAKLDAIHPLRNDALVDRAIALTREHVARLPRANPFLSYLPRLEADLAWLPGQTPETFHAYAFATLRQFGASFELAALFLRWLAEQRDLDLSAPAAELEGIASGAKMLLLKTSRVARGRNAGDVTSPVTSMATAWQRATQDLGACFGVHADGTVSPARS